MGRTAHLSKAESCKLDTVLRANTTRKYGDECHLSLDQ
jgi:hypothetical protein